MIRIVLAEDHAIVRQGLRALLEGAGTYEIVGEAADGLSALALVQETRPDVVILDLQMPDLGGLEVARRLQTASPATKVIVLSMYGAEPAVLEALRNGVKGYVLKGSGIADLITAIHAVLEGRMFLSAPLTEFALTAYVDYAKQATTSVDRYTLLTNREREIVQLAAQGLNTTQIGARLAISPRTAETHRGNALHKLGLTDQQDLVRYARNRGLIENEG